MSFIDPAAITAVAHSVDVPGLSEEAAKALAPDVEHKLRDIIQEAQKFAKHSKRTAVTAEDIKQVLRLRNVDPLYGFCSPDPSRYLRVSGHPELFYVKDPDLSYAKLIETPVAPPPRDMGLHMHWLAVGGVQPRIPENEPLPADQQPLRKRPRIAKEPGKTAAAAAGAGAQQRPPDAAGAGGAAGTVAPGSTAPGSSTSLPFALPGNSTLGPAAASSAALQLQAPVRHLVPKELWVYFDKVVGLLTSHPAAAAADAGAASGLADAAGDGGVALRGVRFSGLHEDGAGAGGAGPSGLPPLPSQPFGTAGSFPTTASSSKAATTTAAAAGAAAPGAAGSSMARSHAAMVRAVLASVGSDVGLHPLTPYFVNFIAEGMRKHRRDLAILLRLLGLARALLSNKDLNIAPYLKQLLPAVMTALLTSPLGAGPLEPHWEVRDAAAAVLVLICRRFSEPYHNVQPQVCRVLTSAWQDPSKGLDTKYGAVVGLAALGPAVVCNLLLPCLEPQLSRVVLPALTAASSSSSGAGGSAGGSSSSSGRAVDAEELEGGAGALLRRQQLQHLQQQQTQAWQLYGVLLEAVGTAMYDRIIGQVRDALPLDALVSRPRHSNAVDWDDIEHAAATQLAADGAAAALSEVRKRPLHVELQLVPASQQQQQQQRLVVLKVHDLVSPAVAAYEAAKQRAQDAAAALTAVHKRPVAPAAAAAAAAAISKAGNGHPAAADTAADMDIDAPEANGHAAQQVGSRPGAQDTTNTSSSRHGRGPRGAQQLKTSSGSHDAAAGGVGGAGKQTAGRRSQTPASSHSRKVPQLSQVLGECWKEDGDVGATLDALSHLFGEGLLPFMPLYQLPACNL